MITGPAGASIWSEDHRKLVPFYRDTLSATGIDPKTATLADLPKLPMIDKSTIRENMGRLCDSEIPGGLHRSTTGGSTGEPLTFYMDRTRQAACHHQRRNL